MALAVFDTLEFVDELEKSGLPEKQARAIAAAVRKAHESSDVATKADLEKLGLQLTIRFGIMLAAAITLAPIVFKFFLHLT